jgi:hypothetical protein
VPDRFEPAYVYARVCGSLARSFLGERAASLAMSVRVGEAWRILFGEAPPVMPESSLAESAERDIKGRATMALRSIAGPLVDEDPFFVALTRKWEFSYLKTVLAAILEHSLELPPLANGSFKPSFNTSGYPDLAAMFHRTGYEWLLETGLDDLPAVKNRLDRQYYDELWRSLASVPAGLAGSLRYLISLEAELVNLSWALRLKRYYSMVGSDIAGLLIELPGAKAGRSALEAVAKRADSRQEWEHWKWESLIPDSHREDGGDWYFDVRSFEAAARRYLFKLLYRRFHFEPDTYVPLYAYFRIKEKETEALHGIIEGLKLEAPASEIGAFAVETTGGAA